MPMLFAMFSEILDGYEPDRLDLLSLAKERLNCKYLISNNRNAIDIMLFDQYGNYVVQTMLNVAIDVRSGNRNGDIKWFAIGLIRSLNSLPHFLFYVLQNRWIRVS